MHPAYSVIVFTTMTGAGYGLLFFTAIAHTFGFAAMGGTGEAVTLTVALTLISAGLLASTRHLGRPERALGSFSQWRTSWLSREGVAAVATYAPAGLLWLAAVFGLEGDWTRVAALLAAVGAVATVYCTGMIYASLRTIRQWHKPVVPFVYLALAAATGALLWVLALAVFGAPSPAAFAVAVLAVAVAAGLKLAYWRAIDADEGQYTVEMATGLGGIGKVRPLDPPHTRPNYVMREMGYAVGRKHAVKLRRIAALALFAAPLVLVLVGAATGWSAPFLTLAILSATLGALVERWLFFAEAAHVSMLYYGVERA